jgi:DNA-binding winged helix-turn-helix (wHTH) protein
VRLRFGEFVFDGGRRQLLRGDVPVPLAPRPFALLELLLLRRPEAVSKDDILERVWDGAAVSDTSLTTAVGQLRLALGETADSPVHLRTVHRFGYAFEGSAVEATTPARPVRALLVRGARQIELMDGELVLGRQGAGIGDVADPSVSRHHARISISPAGVEVEDLGSKNGTYVNDRRVNGRAPIADGDEFRIGNVVFVLRRLDPDVETETRTAV